ncbi:hypothetical protein PFMC_04280 [Plasmodium falciparum CAMP/Malaysia]|nr:hypothetical protein PFMC_04280 [Plasmodium falciparum CAMP/Malaysia]EWC86968.1 hypothetical protein PFNF54_04148 [Plasmodium falciparum NF54]
MNTEEKINTSNDAEDDNNECVKLKKKIENEKYDINNLKDDDVYLSADSSNSYRYDNHVNKKSIKENINEISTNRSQSKKEKDSNEDMYNDKKRNNYKSSSESKEKGDKYCKKDKYDKHDKYDK